MTTDIDFTEFVGHSPSPWTARRDPSHFDSLSDVYSADGQRIGLTHAIPVSAQEADARLMAAAPTLLSIIAERDATIRTLSQKIDELEKRVWFFCACFALDDDDEAERFARDQGIEEPAEFVEMMQAFRAAADRHIDRVTTLPPAQAGE